MATILVVEDNRWNMELVTDLLKADGHAVLRAATAEQGIEMARTERPDLILFDIRPPGMAGSMAVRALKEDPRTDRIPAIALTALAIKGDDASALDVGFDGSLAKPIDTRRFTQNVDRFLSLRGLV